MPLARAPLAAALAALLVAACGDNSKSPADGGAPDAGPADGGDAGPADAGPGDGGVNDGGVDGGACNPTYPAQPAFATLDPVKTLATVLLPDGGPYAHLTVGVSGLDIADFVTSSGTGAVEVDLNETVMDPQFRFGDGLGYGLFSVPVTSANQTLPPVYTVPLPGEGESMDAGSVTSGGLTLTFAAGTAVGVDTLVYNSAPSQEFRAAEIPIALAPVDASLGLEHVYGVGPVATTFCPPAQLTIANTFGWAANTPVDFYALSFSVGGEPPQEPPFASWFVISSGAVSSDGATIATRASTGLPLLTTLAIRRR